ncbi:MAG: DoxX family membrane protein, partial [Elusimicrobia bacterium]|nr:DoxX family membrane protein [Elusimicrobiota bacterium]
MKPRQLAVLAARLAVGAVLVYAGAAKASAPAEEFANVIVSYGLVGPDLALPLAAFLPWIELAVGWALVLGVGARAASAAAAAMFAMFVFALGH